MHDNIEFKFSRLKRHLKDFERVKFKFEGPIWPVSAVYKGTFGSQLVMPIFLCYVYFFGGEGVTLWEPHHKYYYTSRVLQNVI